MRVLRSWDGARTRQRQTVIKLQCFSHHKSLFVENCCCFFSPLRKPHILSQFKGHRKTYQNKSVAFISSFGKTEPCLKTHELLLPWKNNPVCHEHDWGEVTSAPHATEMNSHRTELLEDIIMTWALTSFDFSLWSAWCLTHVSCFSTLLHTQWSIKAGRSIWLAIHATVRTKFIVC